MIIFFVNNRTTNNNTDKDVLAEFDPLISSKKNSIIQFFYKLIEFKKKQNHNHN